MFNKKLSWLLIGSMLVSLFAAPAALAKTKEEKEAALAAKVKAGLVKLGTGQETALVVKLRDKTKRTGYLSKIDTETFAITDPKTGIETNVPYPAVSQAQGKNLSTGAKIAIGVGIGVGIALLALYIFASQLD